MNENYKEETINGAGLLYAAMRDIQIAWKMGLTGQTETESLILTLPHDVKELMKDVIEKLNTDKENAEIRAIRKKYTKHIGYMGQVTVPPEEDKRFHIEMHSYVKGQVQAVYSQVVDCLSQRGYIFQEGRKLEQGGDI